MNSTDYRDGKWHPWTGGRCPVDPRDEVEIMCPSGATMTDTAKHLGWSHMDKISDAVAFRVTEKAEVLREWLTRQAEKHLHVSGYTPSCATLQQQLFELYDAGYLKNPHDD